MANVLLLEDDSVYRGLIERVIRRNYSYAITSVATEVQAWEELSTEEFDLVLMELYIDGRRCRETLKRAAEHPGKPVAIVFSCEDTKENADYALSRGAYAFLSKPFNFVRLKKTIDSALSAKHRAAAEKPGITEEGDDPPMASPEGGLLHSGDGDKVDGTGVASSSDPGTPTVLVVGHERKDRAPLRDVLLSTGFRVMDASGGPTALDTIRKEAVDIVLLGVSESAPDALESCNFLRENRDEMKGVPVLAVTGPREEAVLAALGAGADDFFGGPLEGKFLGEKVRAHVRLRKEYERRFAKGIFLGFRDPPAATAIPAYFRMRLKEEFERSRRYKMQLTLALLAIIEDEKATNSSGAQIGEPVPADPSRAIRTAFRRTDIIATCGENEFSVLMPETRSDQVFTRISDLRDKMQKDLSPGGEETSGVSVRIGVASLPIRSSATSTRRPIRSSEEFFRMARLALFHARLNENHPVAVFDT